VLIILISIVPTKKICSDEIMHMFVGPGAYIRMAPWPPPFTIMRRQDCDAVLKMTLSQGRVKCKKVRMMRTSLAGPRRL
jgi:hypothetical protein